MDLKATPVSKCLDKKMMIFGFEFVDLFVIFLTLSVLNFMFGQTSLKLFLVWLPTLTLAGILRYGKKGRPENYLTHWVRYQIQPGIFSAFNEPLTSKTPPSFYGKEPM